MANLYLLLKELQHKSKVMFAVFSLISWSMSVSLFIGRAVRDLFVCVIFGGKTAGIVQQKRIQNKHSLNYSLLLDARDKVFSHNGLVNLLSTSTMNISSSVQIMY